ncbi:proto-oncogene vav-like [Convolutriloba macropyga]|uniref:proto-oncogene vav-like n=1 Tax=Convolutriloba macropyga TaxID=536237 RepID=UPI003F52635D
MDEHDNVYDAADEYPSQYISMEGKLESWQVFLKWIQQLLTRLLKSFQSSDMSLDREKMRLTNSMLKQFTDLQNISSVERFAQFLSYGSHICLILELVNSEWIDRNRINVSEQVKNSDLLTGENIDLFRHTCRTHLGISNKLILHTEDLQRLMEFGRLISTFSAISASEKFQSRLRTLGIGEEEVGVLQVGSQEGGGGYEAYCLADYCEQSEYFSNKDLQQHFIPMDSIEQMSEGGGGYDTLNYSAEEYPEPCSPVKTNNNSSAGGVEEQEDGRELTEEEEEARAKEEKIRKAYVKIKYITAEIESTEENYSNQLQYLDSVYRASMRKIGIGEDVVREILDDTKIGDLSAAHLSFLSDLIEAQGNIVAFAKVCMRPERMKILVRLYTSYLKNYNRAQEKLDSVLANLTEDKQAILNKADDRAASKGSKSFDIKTNFKQPFQRFCRYPLLLRTLLDAVEKTFDDNKIQVVSCALQTWKHVTDHLNLVKADEEMSSSTLPKVLARVGILEETTPNPATAGSGLSSSQSQDEERRFSFSEQGKESSNRHSVEARASFSVRQHTGSVHYGGPGGRNTPLNYNRVEELEKYGRFIKDEMLFVLIETGNEKSIASRLMSKKYHKYNVTLTELQLIFNKTTILNLRMGVNSTLKYETGNFVSSKSHHGTNSDTPVSNIRLSLQSKTSYVLTFSSEGSFESWKKKLDQVVDMCKRDPERHNGHIFEYYSFQVEKETFTCAVCGFVLKGLVWQGHICILCKITVHPGCRCLSAKCTGVSTPHIVQPAEQEERQTSEMGGKARISARSMTFAGADATDKRFATRSSSFAVNANKQKRESVVTSSSGGDGDESVDELAQLVAHIKLQCTQEEEWFIGMASKQVTKNNLLSLCSPSASTQSTAGSFLIRLSDRDPGYRLAVLDSNAQVKHIQSGGGDGSDEYCDTVPERVFGAAVLVRQLSAPYVTPNNPNGPYVNLGQGQLVFVLNSIELGENNHKTFLCILNLNQLLSNNSSDISANQQQLEAETFSVGDSDLRFISFIPDLL